MLLTFTRLKWLDSTNDFKYTFILRLVVLCGGGTSFLVAVSLRVNPRSRERASRD